MTEELRTHKSKKTLELQTKIRMIFGFEFSNASKVDQKKCEIRDDWWMARLHDIAREGNSTPLNLERVVPFFICRATGPLTMIK